MTATDHTSRAADAVTSPTGRATRRPSVLREYAFAGALLVLIVGAAIALPNFRSISNLVNVLTFASVIFIVALGQTLVVLGRGIDLSVGSMAGLSGAVFTTLVLGGMNAALAFVIVVAMALTIGGAFHGLLITKARISFLIVTLGTLSILRSLIQVVLQGQSKTIQVPVLDWFAHERIASVPVIVLLAATLYAAMALLLRRTAYGRSLYAVGANPEAARLAGVPVDRVMIVAYAVCSLFAAFAGLLLVGQIGSAQPTAGAGIELTSIAAVLLGGTRFSGGYGGVTRTLMGVVFLGVLNNVLFIAGVSSFWQGTASGAALIAAVAVDRSRTE